MVSVHTFFICLLKLTNFFEQLSSLQILRPAHDVLDALLDGVLERVASQGPDPLGHILGLRPYNVMGANLLAERLIDASHTLCLIMNLMGILGYCE